VGPDCESPALSHQRSTGEGAVTRIQERREDREHAKYGITVGRITKIGQEMACGYVCTGWPTWALAAKARGWSLMAIVLRDCAWERRIRALFPDAMIYRSDEVLSLGCWLAVNVWFCNVEPPRGMRIFGDDADHRVMIFSCRQFRQTCPASHTYQQLTMEHSECGGVTDGKWNVHVYRHKSTKELVPGGRLGGRDIYSIVDSTVHGYACPAPQKVITTEIGVAQLQPSTYHAAGLYPLKKPAVRFVVPSVFSPTGWVRQKLTGPEMCQVWDI